MKMIISEADDAEITSRLKETMPSSMFYHTLQNKSDMIKIWKMLPISFLEANKFIVPKK
jgi:hypothetical protein